VVVLLIVWQAYKRRGHGSDLIRCVLGLGLGFFISYNFNLAYENFKEVHADLTED